MVFSNLFLTKLLATFLVLRSSKSLILSTPLIRTGFRAERAVRLHRAPSWGWVPVATTGTGEHLTTWSCCPEWSLESEVLGLVFSNGDQWKLAKAMHGKQLAIAQGGEAPLPPQDPTPPPLLGCPGATLCCRHTPARAQGDACMLLNFPRRDSAPLHSPRCQ